MNDEVSDVAQIVRERIPVGYDAAEMQANLADFYSDFTIEYTRDGGSPRTFPSGLEFSEKLSLALLALRAKVLEERGDVLTAVNAIVPREGEFTMRFSYGDGAS